MKTAIILACATLLAVGPTFVSPARADDLEQVLRRLATLEREHATLEHENATLRERVRRLEGKRNVEPANPRQVIMDAKVDGKPETPQAPYAAMYKAPPPNPTPAFTWTGLYVGGHVGWGRALTSIDDPFSVFTTVGNASNSAAALPIRDFNSQGVLGGIQTGWDYQIGHLVVGSGISFSSADVRGSRSDTLSVTASSPSSTASLTQTRTWSSKIDWLATATARFGYGWDGWLLYTTGGLAISRNSYTFALSGSSTCVGFCLTPNSQGTTLETGADTRTGLIVGTGVEWAFWKAWSATAEYNYMNFGSKQVMLLGTTTSVSNPGGLVTGSNFQTAPIDRSLQIVKLGVNYRLGWTPDAVIAKY
jgi:outer membrane immunogenic protein